MGGNEQVTTWGPRITTATAGGNVDFALVPFVPFVVAFYLQYRFVTFYRHLVVII